MRTIELKLKQKSAPAMSKSPHSIDVAQNHCGRYENKGLGAAKPNRVSAQQFREMRRAERLRARPFSEQGR
jgi:hypothetical protein